jgi:hypothetical protein
MSSTSRKVGILSQEKQQQISDRKEFLRFETKMKSIPISCHQASHSRALTNIMANTVLPWMEEEKRTGPSDNRWLNHELNQMPHLFHHGANEIDIITSILGEILSALQDTTHPCAVHLRGSRRLVDCDHTLAWVLMQALIRLPGGVIRIAGKKLDARSRNECYIPTLQDIDDLRQECEQAGVDPHRGGSVYLHAIFLRDKDEVLKQVDEIGREGQKEAPFTNLKNLIKASQVCNKSEVCTIIYIGLSKSMIERFVGGVNRHWKSHHFEHGMNGILLRMLEKEDTQEKVSTFPILNTNLLGLFESIFAAIWSLDKSLLHKQGNSTNMMGCGSARY